MDTCCDGSAVKDVLEEVLDGTLAVVILVDGVGELTACMDATEGDEGAGCGVWVRITGGTCECTMGGVCISDRLM